jgi:predicted membrane protein
MEHSAKGFVCSIAMRKPIENTGFTPPSGRALGRERHRIALAELLAIIGLALSTFVAATVVSVGIARANVVGNVIDNEGSVFTMALLLGLIFIAMGGLTAFTLPGQKPKKH